MIMILEKLNNSQILQMEFQLCSLYNKIQLFIRKYFNFNLPFLLIFNFTYFQKKYEKIDVFFWRSKMNDSAFEFPSSNDFL